MDRGRKPRLTQLDLDKSSEVWDDLLVFYHPNTLRQIANLRSYLLTLRQQGPLDPVDAWILMVATNRLTGHSPGFFSVYTLPPNQAVSIESQKRINQKRAQVPPERDIKAIILRKDALLTEQAASTRARNADGEYPPARNRLVRRYPRHRQ